ncbi:MAG: hypothetical protein JRJ24_20155, partial [Deltaproteobacteria bacterium]|nr:hypothetical protein [Deltaproteobacteria bacterium]
SVLINCCSERDLGALRINGEFNRCAIVRVANVSPAVVSVGFDIDVSAEGQDDEADPMVYFWSDGGGSFADPSAATTTYTCEQQGVHEITGSVSDDGFVDCIDSWTTTVECVAAPNCGNGMIDVPEECDPPDVPANWTCDPATCLRIPTCGDGIVDTAQGEHCDNVTPDAFCDVNCQNIDRKFATSPRRRMTGPSATTWSRLVRAPASQVFVSRSQTRSSKSSETSASTVS